MSQAALEQIRWTVADLELLPDNGTRYEIIDGELFTPRAPQWSHQRVADKICAALNQWSEATALGEATTAPGIILSNLKRWASIKICRPVRVVPMLKEPLDLAGHDPIQRQGRQLIEAKKVYPGGFVASRGLTAGNLAAKK